MLTAEMPVVENHPCFNDWFLSLQPQLDFFGRRIVKKSTTHTERKGEFFLAVILLPTKDPTPTGGVAAPTCHVSALPADLEHVV